MGAKCKITEFAVRYGKLYLHWKTGMFTHQFRQARLYKTRYRAEEWISSNMRYWDDAKSLYVDEI